MPNMIEDGNTGAVLPMPLNGSSSTSNGSQALAPLPATGDVVLHLGTITDVVRALRETLESKDARGGVQSCVFTTFLAPMSVEDLEETLSVLRELLLVGRAAGSESFLLSLLSLAAKISPKLYRRTARVLDAITVTSPQGEDFFCDAGLGEKLLLSPVPRASLSQILSAIARERDVVDVGRLVREIVRNASAHEKDKIPGRQSPRPTDFDFCVSDWTFGGALTGMAAGGFSGAIGGALAGSAVPGIGTAVGAGAGFIGGAVAGFFGGAQGGASLGEKTFCIGRDNGGAQERGGSSPSVGIATGWCVTVDPTFPPPWVWPGFPRPRPLPFPLPPGTTPPFVPPRWLQSVQESAPSGTEATPAIEQLAPKLYLVHAVGRQGRSTAGAPAA